MSLEELEEKSKELINDINLQNEIDIELIRRIKEALFQYMEHYEDKNIITGQFITRNHAILAMAYTKVFTVPIVITNQSGVVANASGILFSLDHTFLVTNYHVYEEWKRLSNHSKVLFQVGSASIPVEDLKIDSNKSLDLITITITEEIIQKISLVSPKEAFSSNKWNLTAEVGNVVVASGFPGKLREDGQGFSDLHHGAIVESINEVTESKLIIPFDRSTWEKVLGVKEADQLTSLGGFSGGPVFMFTEKEISILGVIFEDGGDFFDGIRVVHSRVLNRDGTIDTTWGY